MTIGGLILTLLRNLPTVLAIIEHLDRMAKEQATEKKVDESLREVENAFRTRDEEALRRALNRK